MNNKGRICLVVLLSAMLTVLSIPVYGAEQNTEETEPAAYAMEAEQPEPDSAEAEQPEPDSTEEEQTAAEAAPETEGPAPEPSEAEPEEDLLQAPSADVVYRTHCQTYGWFPWVTNGEEAGITGQSKRMEAMNIYLENATVSGSIEYRTHCQTYGWLGWVRDGEMTGTTGEAKRLEAIEIRLTGEMARAFDVYYRVHCQNIGWMGWAKNGEQSGTAGYAYRLEGIQIVVMPKGQKPGATVDGIKQATNECFRER